MGKKLDRLKHDFLAKAVSKHGDKYDYSNVEYINNKTNIQISCDVHGKFMQTPATHLSGAGCPKCSSIAGANKKRGKSIISLKDKFENFKAKAIKKHNNKYIYLENKFLGRGVKTTIICPQHGEFQQKPSDHLNGNGCHKCGKISRREALSSNTEEFIAKAAKVHNGKYSYENVEYTSAIAKINITCPIHGNFVQTANDHLNGCGCRHCRTESIGWTDTKWAEAGTKSKYFEDYKVYIVKIWDADEVFFKIGKTFVNMANRFKDINAYYSYKVLDTIVADAYTVSKLERKYQRANKEHKYEPVIKFNGHTECFSKLQIGDKVYE